MTPRWISALPHASASTVVVCQSIPGYLLTSGQCDTARAALIDLSQMAKHAFLPARVDRQGKSDLLATLWFAHTAYAYTRATNDAATWQEVFLPLIKRAVQTLISEGCENVRMDDGGLLSPGSDADTGVTPLSMGFNALWYSTLAMLAEELSSIKDHAGDHFERLAGRFRRSFTKAYWCSAHGWLCDPEQQKTDEHGGSPLPDPAQLLIAILPFSPIPRTKQRQVVLAIRDRALVAAGVRVPVSSRDVALPAHVGEIASPLYLAWLIDGFIKTSDFPQRAIDEARPWLAKLPAEPLMRFYSGGVPAAIDHNDVPDAPTNAEIARARAMVAHRP